MTITNKHWIRRNRQYLAVDLRQLQVKSYIEFLRQCDREYRFLELLGKDMKDYSKLQTLDENLVKAVKKLFEDDVINVDAEIKDEE